MIIRYKDNFEHTSHPFSESQKIQNGTVNDLMKRLLLIAKPLDQIMLKDIYFPVNAFDRTGVYMYFDPITKKPAYIGQSAKLFANQFRRPWHGIDGEWFYFYTTAEIWKMLFCIILFNGEGKVEKLERLLIATTRPPINKQHNKDEDHNELKEYFDEKTIGEYMKGE